MKFVHNIGAFVSLLPALVASHPGSGAGNGYPRPPPSAPTQKKQDLHPRIGLMDNPYVYYPDTSKKSETSTSTSITPPPATATCSSAILGPPCVDCAAPTTTSDTLPPSLTISTSSSRDSPTPTGTSGPLFGDDEIAACDDLTCLSGADWLVASLCAISKCNKLWPESSISSIDGDTLVGNKDAAIVNITTFDLEMNPHYTSVKYIDAVGDKKDNNGTAWYGGAFDVAISQMGGLGTIDGELQTHLDKNMTFLEQAGLYGLTYLTGMYSTSETTIPTTNDGILPWIEKTNGSPVIIRTSSTSSKLTPDQYYTVYTYSDTDVTLWDPMATDFAKTKISVSIDDFRTSIYALQHLDWPHFNQATAPTATIISNSGPIASSSTTSSASANALTTSKSGTSNSASAIVSTATNSQSDSTATPSVITGSTSTASASASAIASVSGDSSSSADPTAIETASAAAGTGTGTDHDDDGCGNDDETTSTNEITSFAPTPTPTSNESASATATAGSDDDGCDDDDSTTSDNASSTATATVTSESSSATATASTTSDGDGENC